MTLENLFNELKYGKDKYANMRSSTSNSKHVDEDYNVYIATARVKELLPLLGENSQVNGYVSKIISKFTDYENRITSGNFVSQVYCKMKMESLVETYNDFSKFIVDNKKIVREIDTDILGRILGATYAGINELSKKAEKEFIVESFPVGIEKSLMEEKKIIEEILAE